MEELLKRAHAGDADAMYELGKAYQFATYTDAPDYEEAFRWYEKAAMLEHIEAMTSVADAMMLGRGCKKDPAMASMWYQEVYDKAKASRG